MARLEQARHAAEAASQSKSLFLATAIHEIRTPLNVILGYSQLLERAPDIPRKYRNAIQTIGTSGAHLLALINDVLDLSKMEAGCTELHQTNFDLNGLLYDLAAMFDVRCQQKQLGWRVEIWHPPTGPLARKVRPSGHAESDTLATWAEEVAHPRSDMQGWRLLVYGDERKLRQVLINLLSNAVKFTDHGELMLKVVLPSTRGLPAPAPPSLGAHPNRPAGDLYSFEVADTGPGIPPESETELFRSFHQGADGVRKGGTGLGLAISSRLISLMGGGLRVESERGRGSRFSFSVPLRPASNEEALSAEARRVRRLTEGASVKALVVDDLVENREVLTALLSDVGCEVTGAEDGTGALELMRSSRPDVIFMDIRMPEMDGLETTKRIRAEFGSKAPKIIAFSATALAHEEKQCSQSGFDAFLSKPFRLESLCQKLEQLLPVRFDYSAAGQRFHETLATVDAGQLRLPKPLNDRLKTAAELYSTTELKRCLSELEKLGEQEKQLAARLRELLLGYDMDAILNILTAIELAHPAYDR